MSVGAEAAQARHAGPESPPHAMSASPGSRSGQSHSGSRSHRSPCAQSSVRSSSEHSRAYSGSVRSRAARSASVGGQSLPGSWEWSGVSFAVQASSSHLEDVITWSTIISLALVWTTPLTFAAIGGLVSERSGVVNIGLEGMMLMGAFFGIWGADVTGWWFGGLVIAMIAGGALALVHAVFAIHLRADQIVSGTAVIFLAYGITGYLYNSHYGFEGTPETTPTVPQYSLNWLGGFLPSRSATSFRTLSATSAC